MGKIRSLIFNNKVLLLILLLAVSLRIPNLNKVPVSMFGDELDVGYQAYSILKTGKDYYGNPLPIHFHSLAEWRTPLYLYSAVPTVAIFGITPYGVRLPAAIFGVLGVLALYLLIKEISNKNIALMAAFILSISPWHIQYSRAGFEVTQLLFFLILGCFFFFKSIHSPKWLWLSMACFALTPWVYSTGKFFTPFLMIAFVLVYYKKLLAFPKKDLINAFIAIVVVGGPIAFSTLFGGGAQRFSYISVFTDPVIESEIGTARLNDARMRGQMGDGITPTLMDRVVHNKFTYVGNIVLKNYLTAFSTTFLFKDGDPNPRHSIDGMGEFYKFEIIPLILGIIFFFRKKLTKEKLIILIWLLLAPVSSAITRDGADHATRLIIMLPPLVFIMANGLVEFVSQFKKNIKIILAILYLTITAIFFFSYQHTYWFHNPWQSERWWHAGIGEAFAALKQVDSQYDRVIISMGGEPMWMFFAAYYQYPPSEWQNHFPINFHEPITGFGDLAFIGKYYFGSIEADGGIYALDRYIDNKTLYLAVAKEVGGNIIMDPSRVPNGLKLIKAIAYPSGEPAYYLFAKK